MLGARYAVIAPLCCGALKYIPRLLSAIMKLALVSILVTRSLDAAVQARMFTIYNTCPFTIWLAIFTDLVSLYQLW